MKFLVYLAGPIKGCTFTEATSWREYVTNNLPKQIVALSPMRGKDPVNIKNQSDEFGRIQDSYEDMPLTSAKGILTRDYNDCTRSDIILANFLGAKSISIGTVMEIAWAKSHNIPLVLVMEHNNIHNHPMIRESVGFIVQDLSSAIATVKSILLPDQYQE